MAIDMKNVNKKALILILIPIVLLMVYFSAGSDPDKKIENEIARYDKEFGEIIHRVEANPFTYVFYTRTNEVAIALVESIDDKSKSHHIHHYFGTVSLTADDPISLSYNGSDQLEQYIIFGVNLDPFVSNIKINNYRAETIEFNNRTLWYVINKGDFKPPIQLKAYSSDGEILYERSL